MWAMGMEVKTFGITKRFGGLTAVDCVNLQISSEEAFGPRGDFESEAV
jgi:ABC-type branched-subunit amino acid transport system ATPase component